MQCLHGLTGLYVLYCFTCYVCTASQAYVYLQPNPGFSYFKRGRSYRAAKVVQSQHSSVCHAGLIWKDGAAVGRAASLPACRRDHHHPSSHPGGTKGHSMSRPIIPEPQRQTPTYTLGTAVEQGLLQSMLGPPADRDPEGTDSKVGSLG